MNDIAQKARKALERLYAWTLSLARHRHAGGALAGVSFIESSLFPIPPDVVLIPMCMARRDRAFFYAAICTVASVAGGLLGYAIGYFLFETVGQAILDFYGYTERFEAFTAQYNAYGAWIVFGAGLTPFPYKVITIASGVSQLDLLVFMVASTIGRGARFFLVAALLWKFGRPVQDFIERRLGLLTLAFFVLLFGGFLTLRFLA